MKGYYKDPEGTARVLRNGWLATGDLGVMTFNDCLKIVGRCKETIVLLGGENVEPLPIESKLLESPLIDQCMVVGQDQKHLGVLIVPSVGGFAASGIAAANAAELSTRTDARELIQSEIRRLVCAANGYKPFERLASLELIGTPFEVGEELTPTFKLRRHVITEKYAALIGRMFGN
jgi:long-chain acyl-CoA synthetase